MGRCGPGLEDSTGRGSQVENKTVSMVQCLRIKQRVWSGALG